MCATKVWKKVLKVISGVGEYYFSVGCVICTLIFCFATVPIPRWILVYFTAIICIDEALLKSKDRLIDHLMFSLSRALQKMW